MPRYLLDTYVLSAVILQPEGAVTRRIAHVGEYAVCTSIVVAGELRYGAERSGSSALKKRVDQTLSALEVLDLSAPADACYAEIRHHLTRAGTPIGPNDMLIAAQALSLDLAVVTANVAEFERVPGLRVENWLTN